jgi:hypothetical protein
LVALGDFNRQAIVLDWPDRADRDDLENTRRRRARDHSLDVVAEFRIRQVAVRIDYRRH